MFVAATWGRLRCSRRTTPLGDLWETPPYVWKPRELRKRHRDTSGADRKKIVHEGGVIRQMQAARSEDAARHVSRVVAAVRLVG